MMVIQLSELPEERLRSEWVETYPLRKSLAVRVATPIRATARNLMLVPL